MDPLRIGLIGLGTMGRGHLEKEQGLDEAKIDAGAIGEIYRTTMIATAWYRTQAYYDSGAWRGTWKDEGGGVVMNQAPHSLDVFIWLGGKPTRVDAKAWTRNHRIEVEDTVSAILEYANGATGYLYTTTAEWPGANRFEYVGDR